MHDSGGRFLWERPSLYAFDAYSHTRGIAYFGTNLSQVSSLEGFLAGVLVRITTLSVDEYALCACMVVGVDSSGNRPSLYAFDAHSHARGKPMVYRRDVVAT